MKLFKREGEELASVVQNPALALKCASDKRWSKKWEEALLSNQGLFKLRFHKYILRVIGPRVTSSGEVTGSGEVMEELLAGAALTEEQYRFWELLKSRGLKQRAKEYLFVITGAFSLWLRDVEVLNALLEILPEEEDYLKGAERFLKRLMNEGFSPEEIWRSVERHIPAFKPEDLEEKSPRHVIAYLEEKLRGIKREEFNVERELSVLRKEFPLLFDKSFEKAYGKRLRRVAEEWLRRVQG